MFVQGEAAVAPPRRFSQTVMSACQKDLQLLTVPLLLLLEPHEGSRAESPLQEEQEEDSSCPVQVLRLHLCSTV